MCSLWMWSKHVMDKWEPPRAGENRRAEWVETFLTVYMWRFYKCIDNKLLGVFILLFIVDKQSFLNCSTETGKKQRQGICLFATIRIICGSLGGNCHDQRILELRQDASTGCDLGLLHRERLGEYNVWEEDNFMNRNTNGGAYSTANPHFPSWKHR